MPTRPLLIAAEGPEGIGRTTVLERIARWLERRGRRVHLVPREPSRLVRSAAASARRRTRLTPRVVALLEAADDAVAADREIRPRLRAGGVVLADRYAWTPVARNVARGTDAEWVGALYAPLPRPDLVLLLRHQPSYVVDQAIAARPSSRELESVTDAFTSFVERLVAAYDRLASSAEMPGTRPWQVRVETLDATRGMDDLERRAREVIRDLM